MDTQGRARSAAAKRRSAASGWGTPRDARRGCARVRRSVFGFAWELGAAFQVSDPGTPSQRTVFTEVRGRPLLTIATPRPLLGHRRAAKSRVIHGPLPHG